MKICCLSDTHQHHKKIKMPEVDMIIHAGDFTYHGELEEVKKFLQWYGEQKAKYKLLVCGNHEVEISKQPFQLLQQMCENEGIQILNNTHTVIQGLTIFGSPNSNKFGHGWAYKSTENELENIYASILPDTDVIITHGPAYGRLDRVLMGNHAGSMALAKRISELSNLKLHVTGHIHESRGTMMRNGVLTVNAAICGIPYTDVIINPVTITL
jgi:Icc-related predicted phosphoesterase